MEKLVGEGHKQRQWPLCREKRKEEASAWSEIRDYECSAMVVVSGCKEGSLGSLGEK